MDLEEVVISSPPSKKNPKGRAFRAVRVHSACANILWDLGKGDKHDRPVVATFAGSEGDLKPFVANLLCGRPAVPVSSSGYRRRNQQDAGYEFMRSAGYKTLWQRHDEGMLVTLYLPDLVVLDPGMVDPKGVKFLAVPGAAYLADQAGKMGVGEIVAYARRLPLVREVNEPEKDHRGHVHKDWREPLSRETLEGMVPMAYLAALHLSNRSRAPIPPDGRFYLQILLAFLKRGIASFSYGGYQDDRKFGRNSRYGFTEEGVGQGFAPGLAFLATHEEVEQTLAGECQEYFSRVEGK